MRVRILTCQEIYSIVSRYNLYHFKLECEDFRKGGGALMAQDSQVIVGQWWCVGSFPEDHTRTYGPETGNLCDTHQGVDGEVDWSMAPMEWATEWVKNLAARFAELGQRTEHCSAFARSTLVVPEPTWVRFCLEYDDALRMWVNGTLLYEGLDYRWIGYGQDTVEIHLPKGESTVILQVLQGEEAWGFTFDVEAIDDPPVSAVMIDELARENEELRQVREGAQARERALGDEIAVLERKLEDAHHHIKVREEDGPSWDLVNDCIYELSRTALAVVGFGRMPAKDQEKIRDINRAFRNNEIEADSVRDAIIEARRLIKEAVPCIRFVGRFGYGERQQTTQNPAYEQALVETMEIARKCGYVDAVSADTEDINTFARQLATAEAADKERVKNAAQMLFTSAVTNLKAIQ